MANKAVAKPAEPDIQGTVPPKRISMVEVLQGRPAGEYLVSDVSVVDSIGSYYIHRPELDLVCDHCDGSRRFVSNDPQVLSYELKAPFSKFEDKIHYLFMNYTCRNCLKHYKTYAVIVAVQLENGNRTTAGIVLKIGEFPQFGPSTPARLLRLLGQTDGALFIKARRLELEGHGIGSFAYYRRIVENQRDTLIAELIKAAKRLGSRPEHIQTLESARANFQFSQSLKDFKEAIPQELLIKGHNPLALLHSALSRGVHNSSDTECLEIATDVRTVLVNFAQRLANVLAEQADLERAVQRLGQQPKPPLG